jgi:signal peptidase I
MQPHKIDGASMEPNFHNGEYLLTDKVSYRFNDPQRGDVIVFKAPPDYQDEYIKRIIGLPGDKVRLEGGSVYINGQLLNEPYLPKDIVTQPGNFITQGREYQVPANSYLVLGDNREHSYDSRNIGFIEYKYITGKAWFIYWPPENIGTVKHPTLSLQ